MLLLFVSVVFGACKTTERPPPPPMGSTGGSVGIILVQMNDRANLNLPPTPEEAQADTMEGFLDVARSASDPNIVSAAVVTSFVAAAPAAGLLARPLGEDKAFIQHIAQTLQEAQQAADAPELVRRRLLEELGERDIDSVFVRRENHIETDWNDRDASYFSALRERGISEALVVEYWPATITTPKRLDREMKVRTHLHARLVDTSSAKNLRTARGCCYAEVPLRYSELGNIDSTAVTEAVR